MVHQKIALSQLSGEEAVLTPPEPDAFAVAGMGALVAATVRAPLTAIVLTVEMTDNYLLILPLLVTCLTSTITAHALGGEPIYSVLLKRTLSRAQMSQ